MVTELHSARSNRRQSLAADVHVCPLSRVPDTLARTGAQHLITLINEHTMPLTPPGIAAQRHLTIAVNDVCAPQEGLVHPCETHVQELLRFARLWDRQGPLVIHCMAGISRSTAAAFITACFFNPGVPEQLIARRLREASRTASPNRLLVQLADECLERKGRMVDAIDAIGRGEPAMEAVPFVLSTRFA